MITDQYAHHAMSIGILTVIFLALVVVVPSPVLAAPTTGVATAISSNNFTVPIDGASGDTWVAFGMLSGYLGWGSQIETSPSSITVYGAPLLGGETYYYQACDSTGCGVERSLSLPAITTVPTPTFGNAYRNLSAQHFRVTSIPAKLPEGYLATGVAPVLLWSIMFFFIMFGYWFRTRSVRMPLVMTFLLAMFIVSPLSGLYLGTIVAWQAIAAGFMAVMLAGIFLSFIRNG